MKKSLIAAWMLIAVVFALGLMGLAGRSIRSRRIRLIGLHPGKNRRHSTKNEPGQLCTGRAPGRDARFL